MTARGYLLKVREQEALLRAVERECNELKSVMAMHAIETSEKVSGGNKQSDLSGVIIKMQHYLETANNEWDKLIDMRLKAKKIISKVENPIYKALLLERYINCLSWEKIAVEMDYTYRHVARMRKLALQEVDKAWDEIEEKENMS